MLQSSAAMYQGSPRGRQGSRPQHTNITELPPDTDTQCGQLKRQQLTAIETALKVLYDLEREAQATHVFGISLSFLPNIYRLCS